MIFYTRVGEIVIFIQLYFSMLNFVSKLFKWLFQSSGFFSSFEFSFTLGLPKWRFESLNIVSQV